MLSRHTLNCLDSALDHPSYILFRSLFMTHEYIASNRNEYLIACGHHLGNVRQKKMLEKGN